MGKILWTIIVILIVLWLLGLVLKIGGGLIHGLLIIAGIIFVIQLVAGRRSL
ncbi:lmo0937 family membrane protein [Psychrobacillus sp. NPDC096426]|uniref:lmo0937 family membrane protein n=1 Tax=Psychrobacillus sp. NPDC096426 TaxID=3364491 RepID=UPI003806AC3D